MVYMKHIFCKWLDCKRKCLKKLCCEATYYEFYVSSNLGKFKSLDYQLIKKSVTKRLRGSEYETEKTPSSDGC